MDDKLIITIQHYDKKATFEDSADIDINEMAVLLNKILIWIGYAPESIKEILAYGDNSYTVWSK